MKVGRLLVQHPAIKVVAFTGSSSAGRTLFDLAVRRPDPIPFFGELGNLNPLVVTPAAAHEHLSEIAEGFVASFTLGAGQFCTSPGCSCSRSVPTVTTCGTRSSLPPRASLRRCAHGRHQSGLPRGSPRSHVVFRHHGADRSSVGRGKRGERPHWPTPGASLARFQNVSDDLLPPPLKDERPWRIPRGVDGRLVMPASADLPQLVV